jgi:hypothetical protein
MQKLAIAKWPSLVDEILCITDDEIDSRAFVRHAGSLVLMRQAPARRQFVESIANQGCGTEPEPCGKPGPDANQYQHRIGSGAREVARHWPWLRSANSRPSRKVRPVSPPRAPHNGSRSQRQALSHTARVDNGRIKSASVESHSTPSRCAQNL